MMPKVDDTEFRIVAEHLPVLCWIARGDGEIFWFNSSWYDYTGTTETDMAGGGWRAVHDPDSLPEVLERWTLCIKSATPFEMIFPLRGKDGAYRPFLTRVRPQIDAEKKAKRWIGVNIDVSDLKSAEHSLRESQALYSSAMSLGRMAAWETNFVTKTRIWTFEGAKLFGLQLPDLLGRVGGNDDEFFLALHPDDRPLQAEFHRLAQMQDTFTAEYRVLWPDGQTRWMSGYGLVVARTPDGHASRMVSIVTDVTERKSREDHAAFLVRELAHRTKNLLAIVQGIASQTGRNSDSLDQFNKAFSKRLLGLGATIDLLSSGEWTGTSLRKLIQSQVAPFVSDLDRTLTTVGPDVHLDAHTAQTIGLALHELTTNALKYGALAQESGQIRVNWELSNEPDVLRLRWLEDGSAKVPAPTHKGFGHYVIKEMLERQLAAKVDIVFAEVGFRWAAVIPLPRTS